jgi:small-conductance mechanosensitive channel
MLQEIFNKSFWNNTLENYLIASAILVFGWFTIYVAKKMIFSRIRKLTKASGIAFLDHSVKITGRFGLPALFMVIIKIGLTYLTIPLDIERNIDRILLSLFTFLIIRLALGLFRFFVELHIDKKGENKEKDKHVKGIMFVLSALIWIIAIVFLLDNWGYSITAIVAGLGIGGIAIALAVQRILGDVFSYFVIFFDRPYEIGDFIIVDGKPGTVENIGIKTTRLRSISGEELIISNTDLTNSRIHNYKRMERRRIKFQIGVTYQTPSEKLLQIPQLVKEIIEEDEPLTEFDRGHFATFGDYSLGFEFSYYVLSSEYKVYMDVQQSINLKIIKAFESNNIQFAYPTQTLFMNNQKSRTE